MGRKKDREKAAKRTANQPVWEGFAAKVNELTSIEAARALAASPAVQGTYASQLRGNLQLYIDSGFKKPAGAETKEGKLYRSFFGNIASTLSPEQRARGAAELSAWLIDAG
jgi:hypothetical protein